MSQPEHEIGNCDHFQPADFIALAESHLRQSAAEEKAWEGRRFAWGGQLTASPYFKGLYMELVRRDGQWVLCALDRSKERLAAEKLGFKELARKN